MGKHTFYKISKKPRSKSSLQHSESKEPLPVAVTKKIELPEYCLLRDLKEKVDFLVQTYGEDTQFFMEAIIEDNDDDTYYATSYISTNVSFTRLETEEELTARLKEIERVKKQELKYKEEKKKREAKKKEREAKRKEKAIEAKRKKYEELKAIFEAEGTE